MRHYSNITVQETSGHPVAEMCNVCVCVFLQMTLQQICADVNRVNAWGQRAYLGSSHKISLLGKPARGVAAFIFEKVKTLNLNKMWKKLLKLLFASLGRLLPVASNPEVRDHEEGRKQTHIPSYQQINCVDNIIRCDKGPTNLTCV